MFRGKKYQEGAMLVESTKLYDVKEDLKNDNESKGKVLISDIESQVWSQILSTRNLLGIARRAVHSCHISIFHCSVVPMKFLKRCIADISVKCSPTR